MTLKDFFYPKQYAISHIEEIEHKRKVVMFYGVHVLGLSIAFSLAIFSAIERDVNNLLANAGALIMGFTSCLILKRTNQLVLMSMFSMVGIGIIYSSVFYLSSIGQASLLWYYTYPLLSFFLLGRTVGTLFIFVFCLLPVGGAALLFPGVFSVFTAVELTRYGVIFLVLILLLWISEYYREMSQNELIKQSESRRREAKIKAEFLTKISHELKTPLNEIMHSLNSLIESKITPNSKKHTKHAIDGCHNLLKLINDSTQMAQIGSQTNQYINPDMEEQEITFDLKETLCDIEKEFYQKAQKKQKQFRMLLSNALPSTVKGYPIKIRVMLSQILFKALNSSKQSNLLLHISNNHQSAHYHTVHFSIIDSKDFLLKKHQIYKNTFHSDPNHHASQKHPSTKTSLISITDRLAHSLGTKVQYKESSIHFMLTFEVTHNSSNPYEVHKKLQNKAALLLTESSLLETIAKEITAPYGWQIFCAKNLNSPIGLSHLKQCTTPLQVHEGGTLYDLIIQHLPSDPHKIKEHINSIKSAAKKYKKTPFLYLTNTQNHSKVSKYFKTFKNPSTVLIEPFQVKDFYRSIQTLFSMLEKANHPEKKALLKKSKPKENILIVEDNIINQKVARSILQGLGKKAIDIASNGLEAMQLSANKTYQLILMDCNMPEMDGYQTAKAIRQIEKYKPTPEHSVIVAVTANTILGDKDKCFASGMDAYITKPILKNNLKKVLDTYLEDYPIVSQ